MKRNHKTLHLGLALWLGISVIVLATGCGRNIAPEEPRFEIAFLDPGIKQPPSGLGYTVESSWDILRSAYPSKVTYTLTDEDIALYDWSNQIITLTVSSSSTLIESYPDLESVIFPDIITGQPFIVVFDGQPLYGGIFIHPRSAMGIDFPVIYLSRYGDVFALKIRPSHSFGLFGGDDSEWQVIKVPEVKEYFLNLSKLKE